jgi:hypothetical protein
VEIVRGTYDVLISADAEEPGNVFIVAHQLVRQDDGKVGPGDPVISAERDANQSEWLLALREDRWFRVGKGAGISDLLDVPPELRRFAQVAYEWALALD